MNAGDSGADEPDPPGEDADEEAEPGASASTPPDRDEPDESSDSDTETDEQSLTERAESEAPAGEIAFDPTAGPHPPGGPEQGEPQPPETDQGKEGAAKAGASDSEPAAAGRGDEPVESAAAGGTPTGAGDPAAEGSADPAAVDGGGTVPGDTGEPVPVPGGSTPPHPESPEPIGGEVGGAPDDQEMPLAVHVEEMIKRLAVVLVIMGIVSAITFPFADRLINFLWYSFLPGLAESCPPPTDLADSASQACPRVYHPLSLMLARLKTASLVGLVVALPVFVYQTYLFMRPGLYPNERRYYLAAVPTSLVLASVGLAFAYFLVLPVIFTYFLSYSLHAVDTIAFSLSQTFDLILLMLGLFAVVFQIPLFMMLAIMMGVTTRQWLVRRRIYFWGGFLGLAFLFSPDPTGMAPFIVAITMVVLFEGTLLLLRWTGR